MNNPNNYYETLGQLVNECKNDLRELFKEHNITSLDTNFGKCYECGADIAYAHIYNDCENGAVERQVSKVIIDCGYIYVIIDDGDLDNEKCSLNDDCYEFDIFSIFNTCYHILTERN